MFFRYKKTPSGQVLQLLESYRNEQGSPRQRIVISLGNAGIAKEHHHKIAKAVEKRLYGMQELFPPEYGHKTRQWIDTILRRIDREGKWRPIQKYCHSQANNTVSEEVVDGVIVNHVTHTQTTSLGPYLVGLHSWKELKMDEYLRSLGFNTFQCNATAISVINRLADPLSEHALGEWLYSTSLPDLLGWDSATKDRYYRVSDKLIGNKSRIERHLRDRQGELFNLDRSILLYDLTNSHFEGACKQNSKARRGKNKQKRDDCPQIVVGMVFNREGFELAHKVFEGTRNDSKSLLDMIEELEALLEEDRFSKGKKPLVVIDAGIATRKNLQLLRSKGFSYLVNDSRRRRHIYRKEFLSEEGFELISGRDGRSEVKVCRLTDPYPIEEKDSSEGEKGGKIVEEVILCKSEGRREKEKAILSNAETRYQEALNRLAKRVEKGQLKDPEKIHRAVGRLQSKHPRVQRYYKVEVKELNPSPFLTEIEGEKERKKKTDHLRHQIVWGYREEIERDDELLGCYVLRTDKQTLSAEDLWKLYMTLIRAEEGFKALKSDLGLRPNYHQKEERVDAHVFITIIAYHLLRLILYRLEGQGDMRCWESLKRILQTHCYTTIILPTTKGKTYRIRKAGEPEEVHKEIYQKLGVNWKKLPTSKVILGKKLTTL